MRPGQNKNSYIVITTDNPASFEKQLEEATNKIWSKPGARHYATQTHIQPAPYPGGRDFYAAILYYDYDDKHDPNKTKECPACNARIPKTSTQHLRCGWKE